jgi:hypothetical protein
MKCTLIISLVALASAGFMEKKTEDNAQASKVESEDKVISAVESFATSHQSASVQAWKAKLESDLAFYATEEGKKEHEKALKELSADSLKEAAEEMQWFADVARDGFINFGNGVKMPVLDKNSNIGMLPKGLPDFPKDRKEYEEFVKVLPVSPGTYSTMLSLKKQPSQLLEVAKDEYKDELESLATLTDEKKPSMIQEKVEETQQTSVEVIKASPKAFKQALKAWEKLVPEAASMLLQTEMVETPEEAKEVFMQAKDLASKASDLHEVVFESVEKVTDKDKLMSVAQNRITSLLMRQSEASLSDFNALEGCRADASDYLSAEARCLCVADNICNKAGQTNGGDYCSIVSSATCMSPQNKKEATEMSVV